MAEWTVKLSSGKSIKVSAQSKRMALSKALAQAGEVGLTAQIQGKDGKTRNGRKPWRNRIKNKPQYVPHVTISPWRRSTWDD